MVHHKHAADTRKPYSGLSRSLVIAIDVGTTFSGVSYAILEPGEIPKIHGVTRFPGQEHVAGNSKIPSVLYYDKSGHVAAAGAEAENSSVAALAEDEGWIKAELFKLRLRPRTMQLNMNGMRLSPLPKRKTPVHLFGDYLAYLYRCTRSFITDTHANGLSLWNSVEQDIQFVLSHPNGWEGPQQTRMRNAAVYGKLVPDTDEGRARIRFVTEGEASLHACVLNGLAADVLSNPSKHGFLIADAGGGTLDISSYAIRGTSPLAMEEIAPPDCIFAGSVFVSRRAREFLEEKLKHSKYGSADSLDHITRKFDETTKRLFRDRNELQFIPFGSPLDKDPAVGIRSGQLRLTGNEVANLFEPSVDAAVTAIKSQIDASNGIIRSVFLVGGYAASPWLFGQLQERLSPLRVTVNRPDSQTSKAVADGAIGFYCDHHVSARMSKFMYGVEFLRELDPSDPDHIARKEKLCELPSGPKLLPDAFDCILARSVRVKESTVFTRKYCTELTNLSMLSVFEVEIWCYRGGNTVPKWINRHDESFSTLCVVQADLSLLNASAEPKMGRGGKKYWTIVFSVEIHFGLTEFKARIKWMDNGQIRYGPAVIVYNERGHRIEDDDVDVYPEDDQTYQSSRSDRNRGSPSSRSNDPYYPPAASATGGSSRRTSTAGIPDVARVERSSSKGYAPSIAPSVAPSARSAATVTPGGPYSNPMRGSDGDRAGSDSDRKKGKDRESRYDDRRSSAYNASPISKIGSTGSGGGGGGGDMLSSGWNANAPNAPGAFPSSRSPSMRPSQSRQTSMYGGEPPAVAGSASPSMFPSQSRQTSMYGGEPPASTGGGDQWGSSGGHDWGAPPRSAVDEQRQSHLWEAEPPHSQLDSMLDRPKTPYVDRPKSPYGHEEQHQPEPSFGRPASPFIDRPKSGVPSAFGDGPPPAMFGDSGPAAEGHPPSMFGDTGGEVNANPPDEWGFNAAPSPVVEPPATTKKGKKKSSGAATPASGLASRTSPAVPNKSPFANNNMFDDAGVGGIANSPATGAGSGLWGSKAPSPYDKGKPLSPLNPAAHMNEAPAENVDNWGFNNNNAGGGEGGGGGGAEGEGATSGGGWGNTGSSWGMPLDEPVKQPSRAPSPVPPPPPVPDPVEEPATAAGKKKKKKSTATTPVKSSPGLFSFDAEEDERKQKEEDDRKQKEEDERRKKEEDERKEREENERKEREAEEHRIKEEEEKAEKERKEKEEAGASSLFGNPSTFTDSGGGDDSWAGGGGGGWGATVGSAVSTLTGGKKKKNTKLGATNTTTKPPAFGGSSLGGWGFGGASGGDESTEPVSAFGNDTTTSGGGGGLFDFNSGPNLGFGAFGTKPVSRAASPIPADTFELTDVPPANPSGAEGGSGDAQGTGDATGGGEATEDKKKKKKKKGAADATEDAPPTPTVEEPPPSAPEPPAAAEPEVAEPVAPVADPEPMTTAGKKKKKKK